MANSLETRATPRRADRLTHDLVTMTLASPVFDHGMHPRVLPRSVQLGKHVLEFVSGEPSRTMLAAD